MKKIRYIIASALVSIGLCACTDTWDSHYSKWDTVIENTEIEAVDEPAADFLIIVTCMHCSTRQV